jgi:hypothetical protein
MYPLLNGAINITPSREDAYYTNSYSNLHFSLAMSAAPRTLFVLTTRNYSSEFQIFTATYNCIDNCNVGKICRLTDGLRGYRHISIVRSMYEIRKKKKKLSKRTATM